MATTNIGDWDKWSKPEATKSDYLWYHVWKFLDAVKESPLETIVTISLLWYITIASFWELDTGEKVWNYVYFLIWSLLIYLILRTLYSFKDIKREYTKKYVLFIIFISFIIIYTLLIIYRWEIWYLIKTIVY